jgi:DNA-binding GntR family transcriptional regulator
MEPPITPVAIPEVRVALARMFVELTAAFHATIFPLGETPGELDANLAVVAVKVMLAHAAGHPMTATELAASLHMPRTSILRRLNVLIAHGLIQRIADRYYLDPVRAREVPHRDRFELILARAFAVIGPYLTEASEMDA